MIEWAAHFKMQSDELKRKPGEDAAVYVDGEEVPETHPDIDVMRVFQSWGAK
jgi:hypothetical protein